MRQKGFTLIEIVAVIGILGVILVSVVSILTNSFRAKTRIELGNRIMQNGSYIVEELRRNMFNADSYTVTCPQIGVGITGISFENVRDGQTMALRCFDMTGGNRIASQSANGDFNLIQINEADVSDCSTFVTCFTSPTTEVSQVNFHFSLRAGNSAGTPEEYIEKNFETKVVLRN